MLKESFHMSLQNIWNNKMRSFLTVLGIVIGVTAIIALITIVEGVTGEVTNQFTSLGAGKVSVQANGTALKQGLTEGEVQQLMALDNVAGVSPTLSFQTAVFGGSSLEESVTVEGRNEIYFQHNTGLVGRGRPLNLLDMDAHSRVCIINDAARKVFFFGQEALGQKLVINGMSFTVVGIENEGDSKDVMSMMSKMMGVDNDCVITIPYPAALRMSGSRNITSLELYMEDASKSEETIANVEAVVNQAFNFKEDSFNVLNLDSLLDTMNTMTGMMTTMLAGIASIALLVGGIGIMNMMLVSVTERTTEIGLRKALGAQPKRIQMQFLMESVVLSLIGGFVGIILGNVISLIVAMVIGFAFQLSTGAIALAFCFSAGVGVLFGWAPARKASRLNPIDALRSM